MARGLKNNYDWKTKHKIRSLCYEIDLKYNILTDIKIISQRELKTVKGQARSSRAEKVAGKMAEE